MYSHIFMFKLLTLFGYSWAKMGWPLIFFCEVIAQLNWYFYVFHFLSSLFMSKALLKGVVSLLLRKLYVTQSIFLDILCSQFSPFLEVIGPPHFGRNMKKHVFMFRTLPSYTFLSHYMNHFRVIFHRSRALLTIERGIALLDFFNINFPK